MFSLQLWPQKLLVALTIGVLLALLGVSSPAKAESPADQPPIDIDIKGGDIIDVARMLSRATGVDIIINEGVEGEIPSMNLKGKTVEEALWLIAQSRNYRCYKVDDQTYIIAPGALPAGPGGQGRPTELSFGGQSSASLPTRPAATSPSQPPPTAVSPAAPVPPQLQTPQQATKEDIVTDKIQLKYEDPATIALGFGGTVLSSEMPTARALLPAHEGPYGRAGRAGTVGSAGYAGELSAPGAPGLGGWGQMRPGEFGGLGGLGGGLGGGYTGRTGGYGGGGYGGGGAGTMGMMLPEGMMPPIALMQQNVLLVRGTQEAIDQFREMLDYLDQPAKQVEIATKFIEIETTADRAHGIDWFVSDGELEFFNLGWAPGEGISVARFTRDRFEAELRMLISDGRAQVINEPRVTTQNNMPAEVNFSTEIPYFYATITYNQFGQREVDYESDTVSVSQALYVTPRINEDDTITMVLEPEIDDQVGTVVGPTGETLPIVTTQTVYTQVRVADGDTLVIGGMIRRNETLNVRKTPLLSEIPILGELFTSKKTAMRNSELLIFVTPRIIREIPRA